MGALLVVGYVGAERDGERLTQGASLVGKGVSQGGVGGTPVRYLMF